MKKTLLLTVSICITLEIQAQPSLQWESYFRKHAGITHQAIDMKVDDQGNCYMLADFNPSGSVDTLLLIKYDPAGVLLWQQDISLQGISPVFGGMLIRKDGSVVIVVNDDAGSHNVYEMWTYNHDGTLLHYSSRLAEYFSGSSFAITLDEDDNLVLGGFSGGLSIIFKRDTSGNLIWETTYDYGGNDYYDWITDVETDTSGSAIVLGNSNDNGIGEFFLIKYDPSGNISWEIHEPYLFAHDLEQDADGNFYVSCDDGGGVNAPFVMKITPAGSVVWQEFLGAAYQIFYNEYRHLTADGNGNTCSMLVSLDYLNHKLARIDSSGTQLSTYYHTPAVNQTFRGTELIRTGANHVMAMGYDYSFTSSIYPDSAVSEIFLIDENGNQEWTIYYPTPEGGVYRIPERIASSDTTFYVAGTEQFNYDNDLQIDSSRLFVYKFHINTITTGSADVKFSDPEITVYPNPFHEESIIRVLLEDNSWVEIALLDLQGRKIKTIAALNFEPGEHQLILRKQNTPPGVYLLTLKTGTSVSIEKLVIQ